MTKRRAILEKLIQQVDPSTRANLVALYTIETFWIRRNLPWPYLNTSCTKRKIALSYNTYVHSTDTTKPHLVSTWPLSGRYNTHPPANQYQDRPHISIVLAPHGPGVPQYIWSVASLTSLYFRRVIKTPEGEIWGRGVCNTGTIASPAICIILHLHFQKCIPQTIFS